MKRSELTNKQKLSVPCPICAAAIGERCRMYSGLSWRKEPHSERKYWAIQAMEHDGRHKVVRMIIRASTSVENDGIWRRLTMRTGHIESAV
jgi:hypothetical protein